MSPMEKKSKKPSKARLTYVSEDDPLLKRLVINSIEFATGRKKLEKLYTQVRLEKPAPEKVWEAVLGKLEVEVLYDEEKLHHIPKEGPLVLIANHPFGVVDGLIFGYLISKVRQDFHVLVNEVLYREEILRQFLLPIDFRSTKEAMRTNISSRNRALEELKNGGAIAIFPAGGVATSPKPLMGKAKDLEWKNFVLKLIKQQEVQVVPLFFHGQNSRLFQLVSHINLNLRLSLLLNEVRNKMGRQVKVEIGSVLSPDELRSIKESSQLLAFLRKKTYELAEV
jgi:putative hemolysin